MAFPTVVGRDGGTWLSATNAPMNLPAGNVGDLLLVFSGSAGNTETYAGSTWNQIPGVSFNLFKWRTATGSDSLTVTGNRGAYVSLRIRGADTTNMLLDGVSGPNPPLLTMPNGAKDYLWITVAMTSIFYTSAGVTAPTNFTNMQVKGIDSTADRTIMTAERQLNSASLDPTAWVASGFTSSFGVAYIIGIGPGVVPSTPGLFYALLD